MSTHSVEKHLNLTIEQYDTVIKTLVPHYDEMLKTGTTLIKAFAKSNPTLIDLGSGTGRLSEALLKEIPDAKITLVDINTDMLAEAKRRLDSNKERVEFMKGSFFDPLPKADAIIASLSLHHIQSLEQKTAVYESIYKSLNPGGFFLGLDITVSSDETLNRHTLANWAKHMVDHGISNEQAWKNFTEWTKEEKYFSLTEELNALAKAGFKSPECFWRKEPMAIFGGLVE